MQWLGDQPLCTQKSKYNFTVGPLYLLLTSSDSTSWILYISVVCILSGPFQFRPMLFKCQLHLCVYLYSLLEELTDQS